MNMKKAFIALMLLLCCAALLVGCGKEEPAVPEPDAVMQYTAVPEQFLARMLTTNYEGRYETLIEATANAATKEDTLAAYDAYCAGFEELVTPELAETMQAAHDPYACDEREYEQGRLLKVTGFDFEEVDKGFNAVTERFTVAVSVSSELGEQTGTVSGEITVRTTDAGERIAGYFFYDNGWLEDLSAPVAAAEETKK